jgi:hypothetical protein
MVKRNPPRFRWEKEKPYFRDGEYNNELHIKYRSISGKWKRMIELWQYSKFLVLISVIRKFFLIIKDGIYFYFSQYSILVLTFCIIKNESIFDVFTL